MPARIVAACVSGAPVSFNGEAGHVHNRFAPMVAGISVAAGSVLEFGLPVRDGRQPTHWHRINKPLSRLARDRKFRDSLICSVNERITSFRLYRISIGYFQDGCTGIPVIEYLSIDRKKWEDVDVLS